MDEILAGEVRRFVRLAGPEPGPVQREMAAYADDNGFPIIGPEVGGVLAILARFVGARRVFEFGSGYGYSASWFLGALPDDGEVVLTEIDADELDLAREYFERTDDLDRATFEHGDAIDIVERYDGPFDVVLIDHDKPRYARGFEAVRDKVAPGGVVVADNMMRGPVEFADVLAGLAGEASEFDESTRGVLDYLDRVRSDPDFETTVLPLGSGIAVSARAQGSPSRREE